MYNDDNAIFYRPWLTRYRHFETWLEEIASYFVARENSGFVEGFNNRIKVIKRRCYGLADKNHFFQRITLELTGGVLFS